MKKLKAWASLCEVDIETGKYCHVMSCNWFTVVEKWLVIGQFCRLYFPEYQVF